MFKECILNLLTALNLIIMEIVHDGWLLKSPPPKRLWKAKWRNRWFVLRSGDLPGQYFLEYYTDNTKKKLKGKIDLDQCEQVDAGITFAERKFEYKFMFDIKTPKRVYYLCAETESAMNRWVDCVCKVCGLRAMGALDEVSLMSPSSPPMQSGLTHTPSMGLDAPLLGLDSPPPSAASTASGPYIPISECITGKKNDHTRFPFGLGDSISRSHHLQAYPSVSSRDISDIPPTEFAPAVPTSASRVHKGPTLPRESYDTPRQLRVSEDNDVTDDQNGSALPKHAPPRPPKPPHLAETSQLEYMNLSSIAHQQSSKQHQIVSPVVNDSTARGSPTPSPSPPAMSKNGIEPTHGDNYDFPRPHRDELRLRQCYTNGPPAASMPNCVFSYDGGEVASPQSLQAPPPRVLRDLKPKSSAGISGESTGDIALNEVNVSSVDLSPPTSGSTSGTDKPLPPSAPPIVDRNLKPFCKKSLENAPASPFVLDPAPVGGARHRRGYQIVSSPNSTPLTANTGFSDSDDQESTLSSPRSRRDSLREEQAFFPSHLGQRDSVHEIQYLDLDLAKNLNTSQPANSKNNIGGASHAKVAEPMKGADSSESAVVYKKVDFVKTEAFNKIRQNLEEGYRTGKTTSTD